MISKKLIARFVKGRSIKTNEWNRRIKGYLGTKPFAQLIGFTLFLILAGTILTASAATTWYVSVGGSDLNSGTIWDEAFATIQKGIDASSDGDTVLVGAGTYVGPGNKDLTISEKEIAVRSADGPERCIIDLENEGKGFILDWSSAASVVEGFTIMNGNPGNTLDYGVGIECFFCSNTIRNCIIKNHSGVQWGAGIDVRAGAHPLVVNCIFTGNHSTTGGGAVMVYQASPTFINCTFYANSGGWGAIAATPSTRFINSIFWGNAPTSIGDGLEISYSDVEGGYIGVGNIDLPPDLVDPENGNFRLSFGSDCIDAGLNGVTSISGQDLDGKPRFIDGDGDLTATVDMGACEYGDICECDYPSEDLDTDGSDLAAYIHEPGELKLVVLAADFGRIDCPVYERNP